MSKCINSKHQCHAYHRLTYHLPVAKKKHPKPRAIQTSLSLEKKKVKRNVWKVGRRLCQKQKQRQDRMSIRTRRNRYKGADIMMESNDSPENSDRGEASEEPCLPSGQSSSDTDTASLKRVV